MDNEITKIYHNAFGIAFQWKHTSSKQGKIQIVFRNMGFYLTPNEIRAFYKHVTEAQEPKNCSCCSVECNARTILLRTPSTKIDLAVNKQELADVHDLIKGTLFQLDLNNYLNNICKH
ncbi:DUF6686 family protein [Pontimicrobium sp. MEBiC01747]